MRSAIATRVRRRQLLSLVAGLLLGVPAAMAADLELLNVSYDPTRELYDEINTVFAAQWKARTGDDLTINQ